MNAVGLGLGEAEAEGIHCQRRDAKKLHRRADQAGCDHVVDKKGAVVGEKHTPAAKEQ